MTGTQRNINKATKYQKVFRSLCCADLTTTLPEEGWCSNIIDHARKGHSGQRTSWKVIWTRETLNLHLSSNTWARMRFTHSRCSNAIVDPATLPRRGPSSACKL